MSKVVGDIAVHVGADISPLQQELRRGSGHLRSFEGDFRGMARRVGRIALGIGAAGAAAAAGAFTLAKRAADAGAEIENLSRIAGAAPERFQRMAYAARTVGVEQGKLADILKDVQDRVGDFMETGGGPMADFFENVAPKVGVTADQFAKLSGPDALQLYIDTLQRAGVNQNQMTFYLEAMSSDLTALQPLLRDGGAEMERLGDQAERTGQVMSDEAVRGAAELSAEMDALKRQIGTSLNTAILENKDEIKDIVDQIGNVWLPALIGMAAQVTTIIEGITDAANLAKSALETVRNDGPGFTRFIDPGRLDPTGGSGDGGGVVLDPVMVPGGSESGAAYGDLLRGMGGNSAPGGGAFGDMLMPRISSRENEFDALAAGARGPADMLRNWAAGGEGRMRDAPMPLGTLTLPPEEELESQRERLADHLDQKLGIISDAADREVEVTQETKDRLGEIEAASRDERLTGMANMFNNLSTLMQTENEKLFKIGQAAAIGEATVSGYRAAVEAWEQGMAIGGPPVAAAFTAASLARTGALISSIASTGPRGGGGGMAGGGGGGQASTAPEPLEIYLHGVSPGSMFSGESLESLLDGLQGAAKGRGYNLMIAR